MNGLFTTLSLIPALNRLAFLLLGALISLMVITSPASAGTQPGAKSVGEIILGTDPVGNPLSDFAGVTVTGDVVSSREMRGSVLLISLWGANCWSCIEELKALQTLYPELRDRGFQILAVNSDDFSSEQIRKGLERSGISVSYPILLDPGLKITSKFTRQYIPVTVIADREGIVRFYKIGFKNSDLEEIRGILEELLR